MRKFLVAAAVAASTLTLAAPVVAQPHAQPQGHAYGYNDSFGQVRRLQVRVDQLQRQISRLDARNVLSKREANRLRTESRGIEQRLHRAARNGLSGRERYSVEREIQRLEVRIQREARDGNNYRR